MSWSVWGITLDEYWSEEPNYTRELGITFPRMGMLVDTYLYNRRVETFEMGLAVNAAMADDPKKALHKIMNPPKEIRMEDLPAMLRAPVKPENIKKVANGV